MEKLILADITEIEIKPSASLSNITAVVADFAELGTVAEALMVKENLNTVQFTSDNIVTGEYTDMKLTSPLFRDVDVQEDNTVTASFAMSEKTELEKRLNKLEAEQQVFKESQTIQDGAIGDLGEELSKVAEGGEA